MTEESKIEIPNFAATSDRKRRFPPKQWLERFRQYTKREYEMDLTELIRGIGRRQTGWSGKEAGIQEDFIWGIGPEALYQMTRAEHRTEPYKIAVRDLIRPSTNIFYQNGTPQPPGILLEMTN